METVSTGWLERSLRRRQDAATRPLAAMRDYQRDELLPLLRENPAYLCAVDMGLGKTAVVLTRISEMVQASKIRRALIIAPVRVAVQTWPSEIALWAHTWWMSHTLLRPDDDHPEILAAIRRIREEVKAEPTRSAIQEIQDFRNEHKAAQWESLLSERTCIHIINKEALERLVETWRGRKDWPYDFVVVDESRDFANYKTKRWEAFDEVRYKIKYLYLLSGVPAPEGIGDYFAQVFMLDQGQRLGNNVTAFRNRYMKRGHFWGTWEPIPGADEAVAAAISDICVVMREEDYLPRDKPFEITRTVKLTREELKTYRRFQRDFVIETPEGEEIEAKTGTSLAQKLLQLASGAVYDDESKWHVFHEQKIAEMKQIREELPGEPLMIAYWHRSSLARLRKLFPRATVMDREGKCVADWNTNKIMELLVHPRSAGHGLNMQMGRGHILVFFDNPLPLDPYLQLRKRMDRSGQSQICKIIHIVTEGTVDTKVVPLLQSKDNAQMAVRRMIRDIRKRGK